MRHGLHAAVMHRVCKGASVTDLRFSWPALASLTTSETSTESVLLLMLQGLQDPHAKVRWAACQAVGQMCTDLGPDIQNDEHATIVPALTEVMKDFNEPRVQAHAAAAVVNFSENCDEEILTGYLDGLITQLLGLLQNGQKLVKVGNTG